MNKLTLLFICMIIAIALIPTAAHAQSPFAGKQATMPPLSEKLCCICCASYGPCGCNICSYCPLVKTGREVERSISQLDQLESLGVRIFRTSQPLMAGQSRKCPKVDALLK